MKIFIFGKIGSGKTTISTLLVKDLYGFEYISIDKFRSVFSDGGFKKEDIAKRKFLDSIVGSKNQIVECVGAGLLWRRLYQKMLSLQEGICVFLIEVPDRIREKRLRNCAKFNKTPWYQDVKKLVKNSYDLDHIEKSVNLIPNIKFSKINNEGPADDAVRIIKEIATGTRDTL